MKRIFIIVSLCISFMHGQDLQKVSLQLKWKYQFQFAGFIIAKEKGFYKHLGIDLNILEYDAKKTDTLEQMKKGKIEFGVSDSALILEAVKGMPIVAMMAIYETSPYILMGLKSSNINTLSDLNGKKIAIYDDINGQAIESMLKIHNISFIKKPITDKLQKLKDKEIDAVISYISNEPYLAKKMGMDVSILNPNDYGFERYGDILFTLQDTIDNNPKLVQNMYKASKKGFEYAFTHIDEVVDIIYKKYNTQNKSKEALLNEAHILKDMIGKDENFGELKQAKVESIAYIYSYSGTVKYKQNNLLNFIYEKVKTDHKINFSKEELNFIEKKQEIRMCVDPNWLPFEKINNEGKYIGILSEYSKLISKKLGLPFILKKTSNYKESLAFLKDNKCDLIMGEMSSPKMKELFLMTQPYFITTRAFAIHSDTQGVQDISQLTKDGSIGILHNSSVDILLKKMDKKVDIVHYDTSLNGLDAVLRKEIVAYVEPISSLAYNIQQSGLQKLYIGGTFPQKVELSIMVNKNLHELIPIINKVIDDITENEKVEILNKWIKVTYKKEIDYVLLFQVIIFFIFLMTILIIFNVKQKKLRGKIELLNNSLEDRVTLEVQKNREKDKLMLSQSRLAQMGEVISMIAHQWRQPLNSLSLLNQTILLKYDKGNLTDETVEFFRLHSKKQIREMSKTIDDFKDFFKPEKVKSVFLFNDVLDNISELLRPIFLSNNIQMTIDISQKYYVKGYQNELGQALLNILNNAKDALIEKKIEKKELSLIVESRENKIHIKITDNAQGISENIIENIFDPYFSTKDHKNGTGLGLYMTKMIVEEHMKGSVSVSNGKRGAIFTIVLDHYNEKKDAQNV